MTSIGLWQLSNVRSRGVSKRSQISLIQLSHSIILQITSSLGQQGFVPEYISSLLWKIEWDSNGSMAGRTSLAVSNFQECGIRNHHRKSVWRSNPHWRRFLGRTLFHGRSKKVSARCRCYEHVLPYQKDCRRCCIPYLAKLWHLRQVGLFMSQDDRLA